MQKPINLEQFPFKDYDLNNLQFLGAGSYGKVYKSKNLKTGQDVAIKQIDMEAIRRENLDEALKSQVNLMKQLKSPFTVQLIQSNFGKKYTYLILELCDTDLRKKMNQGNHKIPEQESVKYFGGIMNGFKILVDNSCIHRDVKPENVLLKGQNVKIADFGFARKADLLGLDKYQQYCGTPIYMAPQLLSGEPYTSKCDIWSLGLMLFEMIYGSPPWPLRCVDSYNQAIHKRPLAFPYDVKIGKQTKDFIKRSLTVDENQRLGWEQAFEHPLVKSRVPGQVILTKPVQPKVRLIFAKMQTQAERKFIDQMQIFKKYENFQNLNFQQFEQLLKQLNPTITTYETNVIFQACDTNNNKLVQRAEFVNMFCSVNYRIDPAIEQEIDQLVGIITSKKIQLKQLFQKFDKNKTKALDYNEFKQMILSIAPRYTNNQIAKLQKKLDSNGTGLIQQKQLVQVIGGGLANQKNYIGLWRERARRNLKMLKVHLKSKNMAAQDVMKMADLNLDKQIDESQFQNLMNKIGFNISKEEVRDIFKMVDSNGSGKISIQELGLLK